METTPAGRSSPRLAIRLLGPLGVFRDGEAVALPPSRKVRALLGYLALAPQPVSRERLCELLWTVPNDPRGELRWCLSRLRPVLDDADRPRVTSQGDRVGLDLGDCDVDATRLLALARGTLDDADLEALRAVASSHAGVFLEGLDVAEVEFEQWLAGRRSELRSAQVRIAAAVASRTAPDAPDAMAAARHWLELAPLDSPAHGHFLALLFRRHMLDDCARHIEAAARLFADEAIDFAPVRAAWERIRAAPPARDVAAAAVLAPPVAAAATAPRRSSVAVMPFRELKGGRTHRSDLGDAITHDVITRLARLRSLFVIARGSVFALAEEELDLAEIGRRLDVDYVATGFLERRGGVAAVAVDVTEAATARILWTDRFEAASNDRFATLDEIGDGIVSSIAAEIETAERNRAILKPPDSLDAWEAYHRGLWHMYRFTAEENALAASFFRRSAALDPTFSRAHAGLSFTHWQNAFQRWGDRRDETRQALESAGRSLLVDDQNPAAHWSMGRALWLSGDPGEAIGALMRSVDLSPNFALGHYSLAFVHAQAGDPAVAVAASDLSRLLSPCDPLLFGMLGSRAVALVRLGRYEEAAHSAVTAAARPNAHVHILAIAAHCLALAGRIEEARGHAARIRLQRPAYRVDEFLDTFQFDPESIALYRAAAARIGLD